MAQRLQLVEDQRIPPLCCSSGWRGGKPGSRAARGRCRIAAGRTPGTLSMKKDRNRNSRTTSGVYSILTVRREFGCRLLPMEADLEFRGMSWEIGETTASIEHPAAPHVFVSFQDTDGNDVTQKIDVTVHHEEGKVTVERDVPDLKLQITVTGPTPQE